MLRRRLAGCLPTSPIFDIPRSLIIRFNGDCRRAGIPKRDAENRTVNGHSLRTTFCTYLAMSGVSPRVAMELMRHSRIELTTRVYTDPSLLPLAAAVESTSSVVTKVVTPGDSDRHFTSSAGTSDRDDRRASEVA